MIDKRKEPGTVHRISKCRKERACAECTVPIPVGSSYMFLNTHDERSNTWSRYVLCSGCERKRSCLLIAELACGTELSYRAGSLLAEIRDRRLEDNDFNHEYQIAWLASEAAYNEESPE